MTTSGSYSYELNAQYVQTFTNGSIVKTPCYIDIKKVPIQVTSITPVDDSAFAGPEVDHYVTLNGDKTQTQYRNYEIIGEIEPIKEG
jgi:hypothetical protein